MAFSHYAIVPDSPVKPASESKVSLPFCETAKKMRGLGISLIVLGTTILIAAALGVLIFHAHQGIVPPTYHYLILATIAAGGALLAFLAIYKGVKLQQRIYDQDPKYRLEKKKEYCEHFKHKVHNPLSKLVGTEAHFPNHFNKSKPEDPKSYVHLSDINKLLEGVVYAPRDDVTSFKSYVLSWNERQKVNHYGVREVCLEKGFYLQITVTSLP